MITSVSGLSGLVGGVGAAGSIRPGAPTAPAVATGAPDFGSVLANVAADAMDTLKASESTALAGMQGKASAQEIVQAIMSAEQTLQTALAIRDKAVSAYQEISRMTI